MSAVPDTMAKMFEAAGWFAGRQVSVSPTVPPNHPAHALLAELGGITLTRPASNMCSIEFLPVSEGIASVRPWEAALHTKMVGIAEQDDGHAELYLTDKGHVVGCSLVHPACFLVGQTVAEALEAIGSGKRARPMLLPGDKEISLYGITFRQGDEGVIGPDELR